MMGALTLLLLTVTGTPRVERYAVVVGYNSSDDPAVPALRYADDDAAQTAALLTELGVEVILLAELDADSRRLYPGLTPATPDRAGLERAMAMVNLRMREARAQGHAAHFFFVYSGHGDVEHDEGYVHLRDGRLWRHQVWQLLRASDAAVNHVVIDACKSYFMVYERGPGGVRARVAGAWAPTDGLPENTGVLVSTSTAADSHEWEAWLSGVFSHEVRSALRGAADLDLDGRITYDEIAAFVWTANAAVPHPRYRPQVFARAPKLHPGFFLDTRAARSDALVVTAPEPRHYYLEDGDGFRLADFNLAANHTVSLHIPPRRPLYLRQPNSGLEYELPVGKALRLETLTSSPVRARSRGAEHASFQKLFGRPFGPGAIVAWQSEEQLRINLATPTQQLKPLRVGLMLGGAALAVGGLIATALAATQRSSSGPQSTGVERARINHTIDTANIAAVTGYSVGAALFGAGLLWSLWPQPRVDPVLGSPHK